MRICMSAGTLFTFPLQKVFAIARDVGFDGMELVINEEFQKVNARKLVQTLGEMVPIRSIHAPFLALDGWGSPVDSLKRCVEIAAHCGVPLVNFHPPSWMGLEFSYWRWLYRISDFQREIGQETVLVAMENMPWTGRFALNGHILSDPRGMVEFACERNLHLTFDCTHMGSGKASFINDFYTFYRSGRIRNIHFSDYGHGRQHLLPGHGILPLTRFLHHLSETRYQETLTLELSPYEFPKGEQIIVESLKEILDYLRRETATAT